MFRKFPPERIDAGRRGLPTKAPRFAASICIALCMTWSCPGYSADELKNETCELKEEDASVVGISSESPSLRSRIETHEPNLIGYTFDDDDVAYLDFTISLKYPLFHTGQFRCKAALWKGLPHPYFAFSGRFGQYIGTRDSSPVIGKRFNPKFFGRYWLGPQEYLDLIYGHESNGQSIDSGPEYFAKRAELLRAGEDADFADDYISRGWDYLGVLLKDHQALGFEDLDVYFSGKYFLDDGLFQGEPEEYNRWERLGNPELEERAEYDGVSLLLDYQITHEWKTFSITRTSVTYTTGYKNIFSNSTVRAELAFSVFALPLMVWAQHGYNSDLANYYENVTSFGFAVEFSTFRDN